MEQRIHHPEALDLRNAVWPGGRFDMGRRSRTARVSGRTEIAQHLVLVTLKGGASRLRVSTDCGHRYVGRDVAGAVSFLPAGRSRSIEIEDVAAEWGTVAIDQALLEPGEAPCRLAPFTNRRDPFAASLVGELARHHRADGGLEPAYAEAMGLALGRHLLARYRGEAGPSESGALPDWKLKRVEAFVAAGLDRPISIAELARVADLSVGRFHHAFKAATGQTPLRHLQEARVRRALELLRDSRLGMVEVAAAVGFANPSQFARVFRAVTGRSPSEAR